MLYPVRIHRALFLVLLAGGVAAAAELRDPGPVPGTSGDGDAPSRVYHTANGLLNRGLYDLAAAEYRRFLTQYADHEKAPVARYGLAVCLFRSQRHDAAAEELARLADDRTLPYAAEVGTMLGRCRLALGEHRQALAAFDGVVRKHAEHELADDAAAGAIEALYLLGEHADVARRAEEFAGSWPASPLGPQVAFHWAGADMGRGQHGQAAERFASLLAAKPAPELADRARLLRAQCLEQVDQLDGAGRAYQELLESGNLRFAPDALVGLARIRHRQGELDAAARLLDRFIQRHGDNDLLGAVHMQRGHLWFEQEDYQQAESSFEAAARAGFDVPDEVAYWVAKCRLRLGETDEAARRLRRLAGRSDSPLAAEALYDRAVALLRSGRERKAEQALGEFLTAAADHPLAPEALYLLATCAHRAGRYDRSGEYCRTFLGRHPEHGRGNEIAFLAAENDYLAGDLSAAANGFEKFVRQHPDSPRAPVATFRVGMCAYRQGQSARAAEWLQRLDLAGEVPEFFLPAVFALGEIACQAGEWKTAEQWLGRYLEQTTDVSLRDHALFKLAFARQQQERFVEALEAYDELLGSTGGGTFALRATFERGQVLMKLEQWSEAGAAFRAVLAGEGAEEFAGYAHYQLGTLALRAGDYPAAARQFERATGRLADPDAQAEAWFQLGEALMASQRYAEAEQAFCSLIERFGDHERAREAEARQALALARQDRTADAVQAVRRLERRGAGELDPGVWATLQYEKAWSLQQEGDVQAAAGIYDRLRTDAAADPQLRSHATLALAEIHAAADRHEAAAELLRPMFADDGARAALTPPVKEQALFRLAICEFKTERFDDAVRRLESFLTEFPESTMTPAALLYCGESLYTLGRHEQAAEHLGRLVSAFPQQDAVVAPGLLRLGECLAALQHWSRSERVLSQYLERFGDHEHWFAAQFGIGWARENQGRYSEAMAAYGPVTARHQGPTAARAQFQIGECLFAEEKYEEAVRELLKVDILYAYPEWSAAALYEAGRCFEKLQQHAQARRQFEAVAAGHPESKWAVMANERLGALSQAASLPGR